MVFNFGEEVAEYDYQVKVSGLGNRLWLVDRSRRLSHAWQKKNVQCMSPLEVSFCFLVYGNKILKKKKKSLWE